jgi:type II secretory pathway component PulF
MTALSFQQLERLSQELSSLSKAGIPIPDGLRKLSAESGTGSFATFAKQLAGSMEQGKSVSQALRNCTPRPPESYIALIECAETAGDFRQAMDVIVEHSRRHRLHRSMITTTLIYPLILVTFALCVFAVVSHVVIPLFNDIFTQLGAELPGLTQLIFQVAEFVRGPIGGVAIILMVALLVGFVFVPRINDFVFKAATLVPSYRVVIGNSDAVILSRFMALMMEKGVETTKILDVASTAVWDQQTAKDIRAMRERAAQGQTMADALPLYMPATAAWLFRQGEERGQLMDACNSISDLCEDRFQVASQRIPIILEPLLIIIVTLVIAFMVIGLYLPLFQIPKIIGS